MRIYIYIHASCPSLFETRDSAKSAYESRATFVRLACAFHARRKRSAAPLSNTPTERNERIVTFEPPVWETAYVQKRWLGENDKNCFYAAGDVWRWNPARSNGKRWLVRHAIRTKKKKNNDHVLASWGAFGSPGRASFLQYTINARYKCAAELLWVRTEFLHHTLDLCLYSNEHNQPQLGVSPITFQPFFQWILQKRDVGYRNKIIISIKFLST